VSRTILIMAAGTGGHVFPGIAIAKALAARGWKVHWMGTRRCMENRLVADAGYPMVHVDMGGVRGKGPLAWMALPWRLAAACWQASVAIFRIRPDVVLSLGGYVALPGGLMAALWRKPLVVHEPGAVAGLANRVLAPLAGEVVAGMEGAFGRKAAQRWANALPKPRRVAWLGTPVRDEIAAVPPPESRYAGRTGPLRLLVVGGSLGAQTLNDLVVAALASMAPEERPQVVHQAGEKLFEGLVSAYQRAQVRAEVVPFIADMAARYAWCDVLVCRSGAVTIAEISAAGVAAILFPLPWFVADEQSANAALLADRGAGIAMAQLETQPAQLAQLLASLTREGLAAMASKARALGRPDATRACADLCEELARAA